MYRWHADIKVGGRGWVWKGQVIYMLIWNTSLISHYKTVIDNTLSMFCDKCLIMLIDNRLEENELVKLIVKITKQELHQDTFVPLFFTFIRWQNCNVMLFKTSQKVQVRNKLRFLNSPKGRLRYFGLAYMPTKFRHLYNEKWADKLSDRQTDKV